MKKIILMLCAACGCPMMAHAEWTSLVSSDMFTGIQSDMTLVVGGIITLSLIILGGIMIVRAMR